MQIPEHYISSSLASERYGITNDHVAVLCRRHKVAGVVVNRTWYVDEQALKSYLEEVRLREETREKERAERLRQEYQTRRAAATQTAPAAAAAPAPRTPRKVRFTDSPLFAAFACAVILTTSTLFVYDHREAYASMLPSSLETASLWGGLQDALGNFAHFVFGSEEPLAQAPAPAPVASSTPVKAIHPTTVVQNTYPVIEHTITQTNVVSGVSEEELTQKLNTLNDSLLARLSTEINNIADSSPATYAQGGVTSNIALSNKIDQLTGTKLSDVTVSGISGLTASEIPDLSSKYLPISGGTLTGSITSSSTATSTFNGGIDLASGCFSVAGVCITGSGGGGTSYTFNYPLTNTSNTIALAFGTTTANAWSAVQTFTSGLLSVGSTTLNASTTITGQLTLTGATTTAANGINLAAGCFAVNGTCITQTGGTITAVGPTGSQATSGAITFATSTTGSDFTITGSGNTITFNLPLASATASGKLSSADWGTFTNKLASSSLQSSAMLAALLGDETGSGSAVFATSATLSSTTLAGATLLANATTTSLAITNAAGCSGTQALVTNASGSISCGSIAGTGGAAFAWTPTSYGNATSTTLGLLNGFLSTASSTINASTTITGALTLRGATTTAANGINLAAGCFAVNGTCITGGGSSYTFAYPLVNTANTISLAFGTTTSNTWSGTQTFTNITVNGTCTGCSAGGSGITSIGPSGQSQSGANITLATSTTGSDFTITAAGNTITYNLPTASASNRGLLSSSDWTTFNSKLDKTSLSGGTGISYNSSTGVFANTGVTSLAAGAGISLSGSTGAVTVTNKIGYPFPNDATTTALTFNGGLTASNITATGTLTLSAIPNAILGTDSSGTVIASSSAIVTNLTVNNNFNLNGKQNTTGLATFNAASTTQLSVSNTAWFGATSSTSINSAGQLALANLSNMVLAADSGGTVVATSTPSAAAYLATSTTATSTFAGGLAVGSNSLNVTRSGTVGIGTNDPSRTFEVSVAGDNYLRINSQATGRVSQVEFYRGSTSNRSYIGPSAGNTYDIWTYENIPIQFAINNVIQLKLNTDGTVQTTGAVGVEGTADSTANADITVHGVGLLALEGTGSGVEYLDSGGTARYGLLFPSSSNTTAVTSRAANGLVQIRANSSTAGAAGESTVAQFAYNLINLYTNLTTSGSIGIGTTSPSQILAVQGNGLISGNLSVAGITATGTLQLSSIGNCNTTQALTTDASGNVACGSINGSGGSPFPFTPVAYGNATSTTLGLLNGFLATASSTINASTTITGALTLTGATTTAANGINLAAGCFAVNGTCITGGGGASLSGTTGQLAYFSGTNTAVGTSSLYISTAGNIGIGTSTPFAKLSIHQNSTDPFTPYLFAIGSSTASATSTLFSVSNAGDVSVGNGALSYTGSTGVTSISSLQLGNLNFDTNAGAVSWIDMPVTSAAANGTVERYTAFLNGNPMITVYGTSDGAGGVVNLGVGIGTTSPYAALAVVGASGVVADHYTATSSATSTFAGGISANLLNITSASASSSFANGINLTSGCFAVNGTCITGGGGASLSGTTGQLAYFSGTNTAVGTSSLYLDATGRLGIGTTSPAHKLAVQGNALVSGNLYTAGLAATGTVQFANYASCSGSSALTTDTSGNITCGTISGAGLTGTKGQVAYFSSSNNGVGTSSLFVDTTGNIGIGTTTPYARLSIQENSTDPFTQYLFAISSSTASATSTLFSVSNAGDVSVGNGALSYTGSTGVTNISSLQLGNLNFESDAGAVSWADMPVTSASASGVVESYTAFLDSTPMITVYGTADGAGGVANLGVGIGTTSPYAALAVVGASGVVADHYTATSTTATSTFAGPLAVGTSTPSTMFAVSGNTLIGGNTSITGSLTLGLGSCLGGQALQANSSGTITCGFIAGSGGSSSAGGWTTNNQGTITLSTTTDEVLVGASTTPYAKFAVLSGATATTTMALVPATSQTADILDIYNTTGSLNSVLTAGNFLGLGTTSPWAQLSVDTTGNSTAPYFVVGSSTATNFVVANNGNVGIGVKSPATALDVMTSGSNSTPTLTLRDTSGNDSLEIYSGTSTLFNVGIGYQAAVTNKTGNKNTVVGYQGLNANIAASGETALGYQALKLSTGNFNTAVGASALAALTTGTANVALGYNALTNSTGSNNTAIGYISMSGTGQTSQSNVAVGYDTLSANSLTGGSNVALGYQVLTNNTSGSNNAGTGYQSLVNNTTATENSGYGLFSLFTNKTGSYNTGLGSRALYSTLNGAGNVGIGYESSWTNTNATNTVAIGYQAASGNGNYHSQGYTITGYAAGTNIITGSDYNTFYGYQSGSNVSSGRGNILVGPSLTADNLTTGNYNIGIGVNTFFASSTMDSQLNIGGLLFGLLPASTTSFGLPTSGTFGIATSSPYAALSVMANSGSTNTALFAIGSSTATATSTLFSIDNTGNITTTITNCFGASALQTNSAGVINCGAVSGGGGGAAITGTTGQITYLSSTNTASGTSTIFITPMGNVGVGTTSPYAKFSIEGNYSDQYNPYLFAIASSTSAATSTVLFTVDSSGDIASGNGGFQFTASSSVTAISGLQTGNLSFDSDAGIVSWVDMPVTSASANGVIESYTANLNGNPMITVYGLSNGSGGVTNLGVGIGTTTPYAQLSVWGSDTSGTTTAFSVINNASTTLLSVMDNGFIGIGTTSPSSRLTVWGPDTATTSAFAVVNSASTTVFAVYDNGNATYSGSIFQSSDANLKTNVQSLSSSSSLSLIDALNPVSYTRIDQPSSGENLGFLAQQVAGVFPELVTTTTPTALTPGGTLTLNYVGLIAPIVSGIKELSSLMSALTDRVAALEAAVSSFGTKFTTKQLCVSDTSGATTCITKSQLDALLSGQSTTATTTSSTSSGQAATSSISIILNGTNPVQIAVGTSYIDLGATVSDTSYPNIGYYVSVDGGATTTQSNVTINTSTVGTHSIVYSVTDPSGNSASTMRSVVVYDPNASTATSTSTTTSTTTSTSTPTTTNTTSTTTPTTIDTTTSTSTATTTSNQ